MVQMYRLVAQRYRARIVRTELHGIGKIVRTRVKKSITCFELRKAIIVYPCVC